MKFNAGDKVICIDNKYNYNEKPILGKEYTVVEVVYSIPKGWFYVKHKDIGSISFRENDFRLSIFSNLTSLELEIANIETMGYKEW